MSTNKVNVSRSIIAAMVIPVLVAGCEQPRNYSQGELASYCGINKNQVLEDLRREDPRIMDLQIKDTTCDINIQYRDGDQIGNTTVSNNDFTSTLLAGGAGMLLGYMAANALMPRGYDNDYRREREYRSYASGGYIPRSNTNTYFRSDSRSVQRVADSKSKPSSSVKSTRTNSMSKLSAGGRSSTFSGG